MSRKKISDEKRLIKTINIYEKDSDFLRSKGISLTRLVRQVTEDIRKGKYQYNYNGI